MIEIIYGLRSKYFLLFLALSVLFISTNSEASSFYWLNCTDIGSRFYLRNGTDVGSSFYWRNGTDVGSSFYRLNRYEVGRRGGGIVSKINCYPRPGKKSLCCSKEYNHVNHTNKTMINDDLRVRK